MTSKNPLDVPFSRRSLVGAAATLGALHFLGAFRRPGGVTLAYADDRGNTSFVIHALSREEIPLIAFDAKDNARTPVAGMTVTLTSLYNDATVTVTTGQDGCAVANIRALDDESADDSETFAARVRVDAEASGYRKFVELDHLVESGQHADDEGVMRNILQVPTQPDDGSPYLSCVCLDGHDIQYLEQSVGLVAENDMVHTLTVQLENGGAGVNWDFAFTSSSVSSNLGTANMTAADSGGTAIATMQGQWLDGAHGIVEGSELRLTFSRTDSYWPRYTLRLLGLTFEQQYLLVPNMCCADYEVAPGLCKQDKDASQEEKEQDESSWIALPDWLTFKGQSSSLSIPFTPIKVFGDTQGNMGISATLFEVPFYKYRDGKRQAIKPEEEFKTFGDFCTTWWDSFVGQLEESMDLIAQADLRNDDGSLKTFGASKWTSKFDVKFTAELLAYGKFTKPQDSKYSLLAHFDIGEKASFALSYCLQKQLFVSGIPIIFAFDFSAAAAASFIFGARCNEYFQNLTWDFKVSEKIKTPSQILVKLHAEVGVSLGVGVIGFASVSFRGYGYFDTALDTNTSTEEEYESTPCPHVKIELGGHFQMTVQLLLFSKTIQLDSFDPVKLYDNWKKKDSGGDKLMFDGGTMPLPSSRYGASTATLASGEILSSDGMTMVTEASLASTVEHSALLSLVDGAPTAFTTVKDTEPHSLDNPGIRDPYAAAPELVTSSYASGGLTTTSAARDAAAGNLSATAGYNPLRGIRPALQEKLWSGVFSAPHIQIVVVGGKRYMLRLSTVEFSVAANDANLYVAADKDGCLFVKAREGNSLPKLVVGEAGNALKMTGGGLAAGLTVDFPQSTANATMARLIGFEDAESYTREEAQELVDKLCSTDTAGTPVNSVDDASVLRTRLTICVFDDASAQWGTPMPIDFALPTTSTEYMRSNSWDVDFQATAGEDGQLYIGLTSVVRPYEGAKTYDEQFDRQFVTLLQVDPATAVVSYAASSVGMLATQGDIYWYPRVAACTIDTDEGRLTYASVFYFFREGITRYLSLRVITGKFSQKEFVGYFDYHDHVFLPEMYTNLYFDDGTYDVRMAAPDGTMKTLVRIFSWSMLGQENTLVDEGDSVSVAWVWSCWRRKNISEGHVLKGVNKLSLGPIELVSETQVSASWFYTVNSGGANGGERLLRCLKCTATLPPDYNRQQAEDAYEEIYPVGSTGDVLTFEVSQDGTRLYAVRAMEGTMPALCDEDQAALAAGCTFSGTYSRTNSPQAELPCYEDTSVEQYQLMCAFLDKESDSFYEFFPMADLDFAPDSIMEVPGCSGRYDFILSSITDITQNMLDVYQVAIPRVIGLQMEAAGCVSKFAMGGDTVKYQVAVANTGNVPIDGFTVTLYGTSVDESGSNDTFIQVLPLKDLANLVQTDNTMVRPSYDADGLPTDTFAVADDARDTSGILWPGKTRLYQSKFTLPKWVQGAVNVQVFVSDPTEHVSTASTLSKMSAMAAGSGTGLTVEKALMGTTVTSVDPRGRVFSSSAPDSSSLVADRVDATYEVQQESSSGSTTPKTGESALLAIAALAAATAAVAAEEKVRKDHRSEDEGETA